MKKIIIALSLLTSLFFNQLLAAPIPENPEVTAAFESRFSGARETTWTESNGLYQVRFTLDGLVSNAWFSNEGTLIAVTRQVSSAELPAALRNELLKQLKGRWISDLFVVETDKGSSWYATLESANGKTILQSIQGANWNRYQPVEVL